MAKKILVADDEKHIVQIVQFNLEKKGNYDVIVASDGEMALEMAKLEKPDLIISDIMMPKMTGFELFEELRLDEETKSIPFIILTAKGQDSYFEEGEEKHGRTSKTVEGNGKRLIRVNLRKHKA